MDKDRAKSARWWGQFMLATVTLFTLPTLGDAARGWLTWYASAQAFLAEHLWLAVILFLFGPVGIPLLRWWTGRIIREATAREAATAKAATETAARSAAAIAGRKLIERWRGLSTDAQTPQDERAWSHYEAALEDFGRTIERIPAKEQAELWKFWGQARYFAHGRLGPAPKSSQGACFAALDTFLKRNLTPPADPPSTTEPAPRPHT